jgi:anti-sigma factor RsiW
MKCSDYVKSIGQKLDGSLGEDRLVEIDRHLAACSRCRAELLLQKRIVESLMKEPLSGLSPDFTHRVSERVRRMSLSARYSWRWPALVPAFASAAAAALVFVFRTGIAAVIAAPMERVGAGVAGPVASLGQSISGVFAAAPGLASGNITIAESISPVPVTMLAAAGIACLAVIAAFYKASTLFHE